MKRIIFASLVAIGLGVGAAAIVLAVFSDEQATTGPVMAALATDIDLYICEPDAVPGPACGADDSLGNEIVFEGNEQLTPGEDAIADLRMQNIGTLPWDIDMFTIDVQESNDPNADCDAEVTIEVRILGRDGDSVNDNHRDFFPEPGHAIQRETASSFYFVHIEPGDYEDLRPRLSIPESAGNECSGNAWDLTTGWTVIDEGSH